MTTMALHERAEALKTRRVPFVHARVVLAERPTSAKPGDEALVLPDGSIEGFVGGTCAESTVRLKGLSLLASGDSMLLRIAPNPESDQPGKTVVHNPCLSGGTLEIFLEPVLPSPLVGVLGDTPMAQAMIRIGSALGYEVRAFDDIDVTGADVVIVATHGKREEETLTAAVRAGVPYIGLIASPKRGSAVLAFLELSDDEKAQIHTPAGLNIGARTPNEIALSVFAQVIEKRTSSTVSRSVGSAESMGSSESTGAADASATAFADVPFASAEPVSTSVTFEVAASVVPTSIDPVCGMTVFEATDGLYADVDGARVWFCCPGCRREFLKNPGKYPRS